MSNAAKKSRGTKTEKDIRFDRGEGHLYPALEAGGGGEIQLDYRFWCC